MATISSDFSATNESVYYNVTSQDAFKAIEGVWEDPTQGLVAYFYRNEDQKPCLIRYQKTSRSLLQEQPPIILDDDALAGIQAEGDRLQIAGEQELQKCRFSLETYPDNSPIKTFDVLRTLLREHYAFASLRNIEIESLMNSVTITDSMSEAELFNQCVLVLAAFKDNHVALCKGLDEESEKYFGFSLRPAFQQGLDTRQTDVDTVTSQAIATIKEHYLADPQQDKALLWGFLKQDPSIGYINILSLECDPEELESTLDRLVDSFKHAKKVIFDVRFNQGGSDELSKMILSRFTHEERLYSYVQTYYDGGQLTPRSESWLKPSKGKKIPNDTIPIFVLTSPITASAAEIFTMMASTLPNVTRIGECTMGILSDQFARILPNGWWVLLSNELRFDPQMNLYEACGIPPHIEAPFPFDQGKDPALDMIS
ncbi:MAG: S41 family peptidase [Rhabdochlamydiaceae bacterium]|nr:S41 family peptidase [Rhabdochlamydiaceae bacterium]